MTYYIIKSDFRSLYFSHVHIFDINYIVNHNLRGIWNIKPNLFVKYNEKPTIYTICVYDEYKHEYWIYDEKTSETQINLIELNDCIKKYETENYFKKVKNMKCPICYDDMDINNILITNIRNANDQLIYRETGGSRSGRGTIYEVATVDPFTGPFGSI